MSEINTLSGRLARNSITGLLRYVIAIPVLLFITPFILHNIGPEQYGVWAIFGIVTAYADLSDLGLFSSLVRFVAQSWAEGDTLAINRSASTVFVIYLTIGGVVSALILQGGYFLAVQVFKVPASLADEAIFVITGAVVVFFVSLLSGTFGALIMGAQRMDLWNARLLLFTLLDAAGSAIVLSLGYGLHGLVINRVAVCVVIGIVNGLTAHRIMPALRIRLSAVSFRTGRKILGYSANILVSKISLILREPLTKTILVRLATLSGVAYFDLAARIANQARGVFVAMLVPLLPASSEIQTKGGAQAIRRLYNRSTRYVILTVLPFFGGLAVLSKPLITLWIGPHYEQVVSTLQILLTSYFFVVAASPAFSIMEGVGLARVSATSSVVTAMLNVILSISLGIRWGYSGVLTGYCLSLVTGSLVTQTLFHRKMSIPIKETLRAMPLRAILVDGCAMAVTETIMYTGLGSISTLILASSVYLLIIICGTIAFRCLEQDEINTMKRLLVVFAK